METYSSSMMVRVDWNSHFVNRIHFQIFVCYYVSQYYSTMLRKIIILFLILLPSTAFCQEKLQKLSVEKIMRDPKWIGSSPSNPYWSQDGKYLLFSWNPENASADSIYYITPTNLHPLKTT